MSKIHEAVERMDFARGVKERIDARQGLQKAIRGARRDDQAGGLVRAYREAIVLWRAMRCDGAPLKDLVAGFATTLRSAWPSTREWKYLCQQCSDYGLIEGDCPGDATCGRTKEHNPHTYGRPCWCDQGRRYKEKQRHEDDPIAAAAKTGKRGGFTKAGF